MRPLLFVLALLLAPVSATADPDRSRTIDTLLDTHVMPGFAALDRATQDLSATTAADCTPDSEALRAAFHTAFDAWMGVGHLRFGPAETDYRAFAIAFWPDTRGMTPKGLTQLLREADPAIGDPEAFRDVSVAARGLYALELLLYDPDMAALADGPETLCALIRAEAADLHATAQAILADWQDTHAGLMRHPAPDAPYRDQREVLQTFFTALIEGLTFDADVRLGRPLGTFERPRAERAEAWRSGRSLRNVVLSLTALRELADLLADAAPDNRADIMADFDRAAGIAADLDDPVFAGVDTPQGRLKVEILQQAIRQIALTARADLGPALGVAAGFNSQDGD